MKLTKNTQENIKDIMIIAAGISPDLFTKKIKAMHELKKALFELTNCDYKELEKELNTIMEAACNEIEKEQEKKRLEGVA